MQEGKSRPPQRKRSGSKPALTAREEMMLELFAVLTPHQQREAVLEMLALGEANRVSRKLMQGRQLRAISNEEVRAAFSDVPPLVRSQKKRPGRDPGDAMGDYLDD